MIGRLVAILVCFAAVSAAAAPLIVRSGEHDGFTRLVVYMDPDPTWRFGRVDGGYELRTSAPDGYDVAAVYTMIRQDRIAALEGRLDGRLMLSVDCDCHGDAFVIPQGIVIDIRDGPPPEASPFEARLDTPSLPEIPAEAVTDEAVAGPGQASANAAPTFRPALSPGPLPVLLPGVALPGMPGPALADTEPNGWPETQSPVAPDGPASAPPGLVRSAEAGIPEDPGAAPESDTAADIDAVVQDAARTIAEQLGRAADQGLIALAPDPAVSPPAPDPAPTPDDAPPPTLSPPVVLADHLRVQTAVDRDRPEGSPVADTGLACLADGRLDLVAWAGERVEMAHYRAALVDAHDRPDPKAIRDAARHAVAIGFGAEARAILAAFDAPVPDAGLLDQLARLVDGGTLPASELAAQIGCDGRAALWAVLARGHLAPGDPVNAAAVQAGFAALPPGLRRSLGPGLAALFLDMGDADTAAALRNAMARAVDGTSPGLDLLDARLDLPAGEDRLDRLGALARGDSPEAVAALVALLDGMADAGRTPDGGLLLQAETLATERSGTLEGMALDRAHLRGLIAAGRFEAAFARLAILRSMAGLDDATLEHLLVELVAAVAQAPEIASLLPRLLAGPMPRSASEPADAARRALAARLIETGLPAAARKVVAARPGPPGEADRLVLARSHLADAAPEAAFVYLAGLSGSGANGLMARALMAAGQPAAAAELFAPVGQPDRAAAASWQAGDWDRVIALGTDGQRAAAALAIAAPANPEAAESPAALLDMSQDLMRRSSDVRRVYRQLLDGAAGG